MRHAFSFFIFRWASAFALACASGSALVFPLRADPMCLVLRVLLFRFFFLRICIFGVLAAFLPERVRVPSKKACR
ncbi:hypothetical protein [Allobaculum sp. Allo2]|uniref:hypothetical protein n=1 Tax=Allobaculum sp. Allo2 TaxID=2853432 RepID=UPI001F6173A6|nr:hypothetical protein [Allobaculum sp. Allo2]UNT93555.1 hypothetical protein KWG61_01830 [Allobaculum sp. Allo2]